MMYWQPQRARESTQDFDDVLYVGSDIVCARQ